MSIINEALKKAEENLQKNTAKDNLLPPQPSGPNPWLLYILILLSGLLLANFIFNRLSKLQTSQAANKNPSPVTPIISPLPIPNPPNPPKEENKSEESRFILNGIFFSDNDGYALINNQIVRKNDYVDKARVSLITANTVELDNAGQKITLSTVR